MDTPYEKLDDATRQEWRDNSTTVAFLGTVACLLTQQEQLALVALAGGGLVDGGAHEGGRIYAYRYVLDIATRKGKAAGE